MADLTSTSYTDPSFWRGSIYSPDNLSALQNSFSKLFNKAYTDRINTPNDLTYAAQSSLDPTANQIATGTPNFSAAAFGQGGTDTSTGLRYTGVSPTYGLDATTPGPFWGNTLSSAMELSAPYQTSLQRAAFTEKAREMPILQQFKNQGDVIRNMADVSYEQTSPIMRQKVQSAVQDQINNNMNATAQMNQSLAIMQNAASTFGALGSSPRGNRTFG
jgi:hypothetical protein